MKYFVVADVHGFCTKMKRALKEAGFDRDNLDHIFVSLGDLLDRGDQPRECLEFVMGLDPSRRILIRGNHEDLMEEAIARHKFYSHDATNGTMKTALDLTGETIEFEAIRKLREDKLYNSYIAECVDYYETKKYVFVHGWIPCEAQYWGSLTVPVSDTIKYKTKYRYYSLLPGDWRILDNHAWKQARWTNGMDAWAQGVRVEGKTVLCGHWHTSWGHCHLHNDSPEDNEPYGQKAKWDPFYDDGIIAVDACTAYSMQLNCVVVEDEPQKENK